MKFVLITRDTDLADEARQAFPIPHRLDIYEDWRQGLAGCADADVLFVDLLATLSTPHRIAGYEAFGAAKLHHPAAASVPLILIGAGAHYELDYMVGWPNFIVAYLQRPVTGQSLVRALGWPVT